MSNFLSHFSPQRSSPEDLEKILVQREALLAASVAKLRESALTASKHHLLFVGPRGAGKTNLVALIHHRLQGQADLADRVRFAWLNEDETSSSFLKLLLRVYRALAARYPAEFTLSLATEVIGRAPDEALAVLERAFLEHLGSRVCVVLIENLDHLFDTMPEGELRRWRAFVQNNPVFATVGTAQRLFDGVSRRDHVFFGFFDTQHLRPLSPDEARELLKKLALHGAPSPERSELHAYLESPKGLARLNAIHHLTGGNPRLYLILADFLTRDTLDALVPAFEKMADQQLTPYYQERLRWLSPQQREIVEYLCQQQHPIVPVKTIAAALFAEHSSIASQLKKLRDMGYVVGRERSRAVYCELAEPLMRLSFQVKEVTSNGAKGPAPLRLIVDMLRIWFEQKQLEATLATLTPDAAGRDYFALAAAENLTSGVSRCVEILRQCVDGVDVKNCSDEEFASLEALAEESGEVEDLMRFADVCRVRELWDKLLATCTKTLECPQLDRWERCRALMGKVNAQVGLKQWNDAVGGMDEIIRGMTDTLQEAEGDADGMVNKEFHVAMALGVRSTMFSVLGQHEECLRDLMALVHAPEDEFQKMIMQQSVPDIRSTELVRSLFALSCTTPIWQTQAAEFVRYWAKFEILPHLGNALIAYLPALKASPLKPEALRAWHAGWVEAGKGHPEFDLPLKLLETGLIFLETEDEGELLRLPTEQRTLLRQALQLPPETN